MTPEDLRKAKELCERAESTTQSYEGGRNPFDDFFTPTRVAGLLEEIQLSRELFGEEQIGDRDSECRFCGKEYARQPHVPGCPWPRLAQLRNGTASKEPTHD